MSERIDTIARQVVDAREARDAAKLAFDNAEDEYRQAERALWDHMDEIGHTTFTNDLGPGYGKVQFQKRETLRGIVTDKDAAIKALKDADLDEGFLGQPEIRKAALNEHVRDLLAAGQTLPEGVDFTRKAFVSISRK